MNQQRKTRGFRKKNIIDNRQVVTYLENKNVDIDHLLRTITFDPNAPSDDEAFDSLAMNLVDYASIDPSYQALADEELRTEYQKHFFDRILNVANIGNNV